MQMDFHYYATYCAAYLAGYSHKDSLAVAHSAQLVDCCSRTFLMKTGGPKAAATTQLQLELMDADTDLFGLQDITRIWASFHFLPGDLYAGKSGCGRRYLQKYSLICGPNGALLADTVELARWMGNEAAGIAMHVLADTWAHRYFAGTPSLVINNTNYYFYEILPGEDGFLERAVKFNHNLMSADDPGKGVYTATLYQGNENSVMNLGHGRAGHLPDYSFARYRYMPAWADYQEIYKDNPSDYWQAFCQMVYALKSLRMPGGHFETGRYALEETLPWEKQIRQILEIRQCDACVGWKALGESISGEVIPDFNEEEYQASYMEADPERKDETFLGRFFIAALAQKSMVTNRIFQSGSLLAGSSVDFGEKGFRGIRDFRKLIEIRNRRDHD